MLVLPTGFYQLARISGYKGSSLSQFAVPNLTLFKMYLLTFFENCFKPVLQHRFILTDNGVLNVKSAIVSNMSSIFIKFSQLFFEEEYGDQSEDLVCAFMG